MSSVGSVTASSAAQVGASQTSSSGVSPVRAAISNLLGAVQSGDLETAKAAYVAVKGQLGPATSASQASPIDQIGLALAAGNIEAAQGIVAGAKSPRTGAAVSGQDQAGQAKNAAAKAAFRGSFINLVQSLQSGDLQGAGTAHDALMSLKGAGNTLATTDGGGDGFSTMMNTLGAALNAGDITSAQSIFSEFAQSVPAGATVDVLA